ncbi:MAG: hypothetical protein ACI9K1_001417 [Arcticibacterium sp.]|jgi:hypothetical protein
MNKLSSNLKDFVVEQSGDSNTALLDSTTLQNDLSIWGDDAVDFLEAYGKRFEVDLSEFDITKYFKPEGDAILPAIVRFFTGKKPPEYIPLTLGDLENGIKQGKLT